MDEPLTDEQIADFWDWEISDSWVRERLAKRIRDAGFIVVRAPKPTSASPTEEDNRG